MDIIKDLLFLIFYGLLIYFAIIMIRVARKQEKMLNIQMEELRKDIENDKE